ncbi:hypothetical protein CYFUS_001677 [Cystobacter fuscus]|uniref:Uncharacterized protein n=1 Tax=Cystobacter fuscus TaxID=43 RepID=A0A250IY96_9BACT|nr:hypothetical protein [Cystobacter fuscus]ATB36263.1 hypothetical protein CYFUS_001677 [Cystobacter fuscus]
MRTRFRIVHFVPDLVAGSRVPIAALVESEGRVQVARAEHIPGPHCVGGKAAWFSLRMALEDLDFTDSFEQLPRSLGAFVHMDEARFVPATVTDPVQWVERHVLPRRPILPEDQAERPPPALKRHVQGMRFLQTCKVAHYVQSNFNGSLLSIHEDTASHISHFVAGDTGLLLMEPIIASRADFHEELRHVSNAFLAWRQLFEKRQVARRYSFLAYVLDGRRGESSTVRGVLKEAEAEVLDVDVPSERDKLIERIRYVGISNPAQNELPIES